MSKTDRRYRTDLNESDRKLLQFIRVYVQLHGVAPTYREMATAMGWDNARGWLVTCVERLEEAGKIQRFPRIHRGIELVHGA